MVEIAEIFGENRGKFVKNGENGFSSLEQYPWPGNLWDKIYLKRDKLHVFTKYFFDHLKKKNIKNFTFLRNGSTELQS